jgi:hypothetical protein
MLHGFAHFTSASSSAYLFTSYSSSVIAIFFYVSQTTLLFLHAPKTPRPPFQCCSKCQHSGSMMMLPCLGLPPSFSFCSSSCASYGQWILPFPSSRPSLRLFFVPSRFAAEQRSTPFFSSLSTRSKRSSEPRGYRGFPLAVRPFLPILTSLEFTDFSLSTTHHSSTFHQKWPPSSSVFPLHYLPTLCSSLRVMSSIGLRLFSRVCFPRRVRVCSSVLFPNSPAKPASARRHASLGYPSSLLRPSRSLLVRHHSTHRVLPVPSESTVTAYRPQRTSIFLLFNYGRQLSFHFLLLCVRCVESKALAQRRAPRAFTVLKEVQVCTGSRFSLSCMCWKQGPSLPTVCHVASPTFYSPCVRVVRVMFRVIPSMLVLRSPRISWP